MNDTGLTATTEAGMDQMDHATDEHAGMDPDAMGISLAGEGAIADRTIEVVVREFSYDPTPIEVAAGEMVEFIVHNEGAIQHEFRVTTVEAAEHHIAEGHLDHSDVLEPGVMVLDPGQSGTMLVTFDKADEFDVITYLIPTHHEAGMSAELKIGG